jgi:hypothetical protein
MAGFDFDALVRSLAAGHSRRRLTRILGGLAVVGPSIFVGWQATAAKPKKRRKKRRRRRAPVPPPQGSSPPLDPSPDPCAGRQDDDQCDGDGRCLNGVCNPPPDCRSIGQCGVDPFEIPCCSVDCVLLGSDFFCGSVLAGFPCQVNLGCKSGPCIGYRCSQVGVGSFCAATCNGGPCAGIDTECVSGQCGCVDTSSPPSCTCRRATCGGVGASCFPDPVTGDDGSLDCCEGRCVEDAVGSFRCATG